MIVVPEESRLLVVSQHDHALLAREVLSLWRADGLPEHPRRDELLFAAREHDNGWREADSAPRVDPATGRPHDFTTVPPDVRIEIWLRGAARYAGRRPRAALLITRHALALHRDRRGEEPWEEELFAPLDERYEELLEETGADEEAVEADYRFLELADALSLAACGRWTDWTHRNGIGERGGYRFRYRPDGRGAAGELLLDPFPLAGATTFRVRCRRIPDRAYRGDADLGGELALAPWEEVRIRLIPGGAGASGVVT